MGIACCCLYVNKGIYCEMNVLFLKVFRQVLRDEIWDTFYVQIGKVYNGRVCYVQFIIIMVIDLQWGDYPRSKAVLQFSHNLIELGMKSLWQNRWTWDPQTAKVQRGCRWVASCQLRYGSTEEEYSTCRSVMLGWIIWLRLKRG